jgi:hypothetical protein
MKWLNFDRMRLMLIVFVAAVVLSGIGLTQGATITVGSGTDYDYDTIQAGIDAANDGDEVLVALGEYVITEPITFRGKAITVISEAGRDETTIRMGTPVDVNRGSVVVFESNETVESILDGFTITGGGGIFEPSLGVWGGGGILFKASSGTVRNCTIVQNRADDGGGVTVFSESSASITNCIIRENLSTGGSGGLCCWDNSSVTMSYCTIAENTANAGGGVFGGENSFITMSHCLIVNNKAYTGSGGMETWHQSSADVTNCLIAWNTASGLGGGGINCSIQGSATIINSIIRGNTAPKGREIWVRNAGTLSISYSNVAGGQAEATIEGGTINWGEGNIDADPCFACVGYWDPNGTNRNPWDDFWVDSDYHLKSQAGRWDPNRGSWVKDDVTSSCIDAGDPNSDYSGELWPNGGRINMGAYGGTAEASKSGHDETLLHIAYIYYNDITVAESFQSLLESHGCPTSLIKSNDVTATLLDSIDLIIVADDYFHAGASTNPIGTGSLIATIEDSGKPVLGLGDGGYDFFGELDLSIGNPYGGHSSKNGIRVIDPENSLFSTPYPIEIPDDNILQLYVETSSIGIYLWPDVPETVTVIGSEPDDAGYYPLLMEHNRYLLWGFDESPQKMTDVGKRLFINVVIWAANAAWESEI